MPAINLGSFCFGLVIGWITYRTIRHQGSNPAVSDIAAIIGAIGGGTITTLSSKAEIYFPWYCVGLAVGFFLYLFIMVAIISKGEKNKEYKKYL